MLGYRTLLLTFKLNGLNGCQSRGNVLFILMLHTPSLCLLAQSTLMSLNIQLPVSSAIDDFILCKSWRKSQTFFFLVSSKCCINKHIFEAFNQNQSSHNCRESCFSKQMVNSSSVTTGRNSLLLKHCPDLILRTVIREIQACLDGEESAKIQPITSWFLLWSFLCL